MVIPYGKVLIYALTFLGYAYSGYGSGLLANLRDAVIAAESVFGDVMKNAISVLTKFKNLNEVFDAAIEEECIFKCTTEGARPTPNRNHVPKANGCGALGLSIDTKYLPVNEMTKCCNAHDICYDTCNNKKEVCDIEFKRCLYQYCSTYQATIGEPMVKACKAASKILFQGTLALGCKAYLDAQKEACYCPIYGKSKSYNKKKYSRGDGDL
ncbi:hypothetical protein ILUMI_04553 [Ignelater luminosus]|uniref:Group XIIA secretory phospholipase A2 n=1 Tax=Ignelater luminosus TaxID=2038154 RepID=A0A8K0D8X0_IGNLU|nr:hypothetical protein ILUMI_04553 [Ignelater luminosus]